MNKIPFSESELKVVKEIPGRGGLVTREYDRPITDKENLRMLYEEDHPLWACGGRSGAQTFCPSLIPDNVARHFVYDGTTADRMKNDPLYDGIDMFGIKWKFVPTAGGSMEDPDYPHPLENANDWEKVIKFPDVDSWDWEGGRKDAETYLQDDKWVLTYMLNGAWFERLISFMGFENAAMALIDEDQEDALKALFDKTTAVYEKIADKFAEYFPQVDMFNQHDDWGSQQSPFFSEDAANNMIVPYMRRFTDHLRSRGIAADMHSCGHNESRIQCYIDGGWQSWGPQPMNDVDKLFEGYGDKIIFTLTVNLPANMTDAEQREAADKFVDTHCVPGKKFKVNYTAGCFPFEEELYRASRKRYLEF